MRCADSGLGTKRGRGPDAVGELQQHSKQLRMMGQDPLPSTLQQAQLAGIQQGPFSQVGTHKRTQYQSACIDSRSIAALRLVNGLKAGATEQAAHT